MKIYRVSFSSETKKLGETLAKKLILLARRNSAKGKFEGHARVIALSGDLGSGKTTFTQGFLRGLGARGRVSSPTFVLIKRYKIPTSRLQPPTSNLQHVYHCDFYRLHSAAQLEPLGLKEILSDPRNIVIIEWPEKIKGVIPKDAIKIRFEHGKMETERSIRFYS